MIRITRRRWIAGGAAGVAAAGGAALYLGFDAAARPEAVIVEHLRRVLPGLATSQAELKTFAVEFLKRSPWRGPKLKVALAVMDTPEVLAALPAGSRAAYDWWSRQLLTTFLFSTDFFGAAERDPRRTTFVAYADVYDLGCSNPLARFA